jgi:hypothetical protein
MGAEPMCGIKIELWYTYTCIKPLDGLRQYCMNEYIVFIALSFQSRQVDIDTSYNMILRYSRLTQQGVKQLTLTVPPLKDP